MNDRMPPDQVRAFWDEQARAHGAAPDASWSDVPAIDMEIREIGARLDDGDTVLDVGCANGYSTVRFAAAKAIDITGVDYVPEMVDEAIRRADTSAESLAGAATFEIGDALDLRFGAGSFDKVISTRVIINLGDWDRQLAGLRECLRVLKPGGLFLLSEASVQGWRRMNAMRAEFGLAEIPMPRFNNYIDDERLARDLSDEAELAELVNFSSTYFVATRVLKPLMAAVAGDGGVVANPLGEWNRWASMLPSAGDYGTQKLFVLRKL